MVDYGESLRLQDINFTSENYKDNKEQQQAGQKVS
jgi:hypothetical protein